MCRDKTHDRFFLTFVFLQAHFIPTQLLADSVFRFFGTFVILFVVKNYRPMFTESIYYVVGGLLVVLAILLLAMAVRDILLKKRSKSLILLLILAPVVGPLIYFQTSRGK